MSRQWRKIVRDLRASWGRTLFMIVALAAGLTSLGTVLTMQGVLRREMARNYLEGRPASATFDVGPGGVSDALLEQTRERPEVAAAERRATLTARFRHPDGPWRAAKLFVLEDFERTSVARLGWEAGASVPSDRGVLIERSALMVVGASIGDVVELAAVGGEPLEVTIEGAVHEPALAPAVTEQAGYFYATPRLLGRLSPDAPLDELRILVREQPLNATSVEQQVVAVGRWLVDEGVELHEVRVPPPGQHPHQAPSDTVLVVLAIFALLTAVLSAVLCAALLSTALARQVREIGVLKALGAGRREIRRLYAAMLLVISGCALLLAAPLIHHASHAAIDAIAALLNFEIASYEPPSWVHATVLLSAVALPLLTGAPAIVRASRASIRRTLGEHGAAPPRRPVRGRVRNMLVRTATTNMSRSRRRFLLTVALLGIGGAVFVGAASLADGWERMTLKVLETRHYDVELELAHPPGEPELRDLPSAERVELWGRAPATLAHPSGLPISRTYPDGGHGSLWVLGAPDDMQLVDVEVREGRWLRPDDASAVVLNQLAAARGETKTVGDRVTLMVEGRALDLEVVGIVDEVAAPAVAYVRARTFAEQTGQQPRVLRVKTTDVDAVQRSLSARGAAIVSAVPLQLLFNAMGEHVVVLIRLLLGLAVLMAVVGVLALASTMSTNVVERTREIGVLRAIGARPRHVRGLLLLEGSLTAATSLPLMLLVAIPTAAIVGEVIGRLAFRLPLPLDVSWTAAMLWAFAVMVLSVPASLVPVRSVERSSVREALTHV